MRRSHHFRLTRQGATHHFQSADNACKFTPTGGTVWVARPIPICGNAEPCSLEAFQRPAAAPADRTQCSESKCRGHGARHRPEFHQGSVDDFFRIPSSSETEGTGLGLAIVRRFVSAFGGKSGWRAMRALDVSSVFSFRSLPLARWMRTEVRRNETGRKKMPAGGR